MNMSQRLHHQFLGKALLTARGFHFFVMHDEQSYVSVFYSQNTNFFKLGEGEKINQIVHSHVKFWALTLTQRHSVHTVTFRRLIKNRGNNTEGPGKFLD